MIYVPQTPYCSQSTKSAVKRKVSNSKDRKVVNLFFIDIAGLALYV